MAHYVEQRRKQNQWDTGATVGAMDHGMKKVNRLSCCDNCRMTSLFVLCVNSVISITSLSQ